jgi:hypothetical protein
LPAPHAWQAALLVAASAVEYLPGAHLVQASAVERPKDVVYVPAGQDVHAVAPEEAAYVAAAHGRHAEKDDAPTVLE